MLTDENPPPPRGSSEGVERRGGPEAHGLETGFMLVPNHLDPSLIASGSDRAMHILIGQLTTGAPRLLRAQASASSRLLSTSRVVAQKHKVLLLDEVRLAKSQLAQLSNAATVIESSATTRAELIQKFKTGGEYADVVGIYRHFGAARSVKITGRFDQELVEQLPKSLRYIVHNGAGYDQLDVAALSQRRIQASNVPTAVDDATSDVALYLLLGAIRRFPLARAHMDKGSFNSAFPFLEAHDPRAKTLGIVGAGGIGRAFAYKASHALGMKVIYHNRNRLDPKLEAEAAKGGMEYFASLDDLLARSDVVSLHCPLTPATKGLIGTHQLHKMKKSAILINTARGPVVKEQELAQALEQGVIAGAGLDVFEAEPKIHEQLLALKDSKVELLPHVGTLTLETQTEMEAVCLRNLLQGLQTGKLAFTVPEQTDVDFS